MAASSTRQRARQSINLKAAIAATIARIRSRRTVLAGSWNQRMPTSTVPTAPMPPQTAYAVPIAIDRDANSRRPMLIVTDPRKASVQGTFRKPSTNRSDVVNPTSNSPPTIKNSQGMTFLSLDGRFGFVTLLPMTRPLTIGNRIAPARFLAFLAFLVVGYPVAASFLGHWALAAMASFDVAAVLFLISCMPLLGTREARVIRDHARANDANRVLLLVLTAIILGTMLTAISAEAVGHNPQPVTKGLIIITLALAWLFANTVYAFHYAHLVYMHPDVGCVGLEFPRTTHPVYWDFVYFSFTCGMAFATSDVVVTESHMR